MTYEFADHAPPPWAHQRAGFELSRDAEFYALLMEQRTGKSRIIVDTCAYNYERGRIDGALILAPNGVHLNWVSEGFAQFLPRRVPAKMIAWRTGKMATKTAVAALDELLTFGGLAVLTLNFDALTTQTAKKYLAKYLRKRKLLIAADESDDLSTPGAKRTQTAIRAAKWGVMRRILTGTPAAESPFSLYAQTNFLKMGLLGFESFLSFKHHHAEWEDGYNHGTETKFETIKRGDDGRPKYLNLDELQAKLARFSYRTTRLECGGQLPRYATRPFVLAPAQRAAYDALREEYRAEIAEQGAVSARMVLVRYARLQQIASGFVPLDREPQCCPACRATDPDCLACDGIGIVLTPEQIVDLPNPRLDALEAELRGTQGQTVIWTRFTRDADAVIQRLQTLGRRPGRYDGRATGEARAADKLAFAAGSLTDMVASPQAGGRGLDFSAARTAIFYSHNWSLRMRLQAQDRIETLKRNDSVVIVDLVGVDTVDEPIIDCHRNKRDVQDAITGDRAREWL